jgi:predicted P-loop ATPase
MGGKSKQDEKRFKELTSKNYFSLRASYGRHNQDYKRLAILAGTSNDPQLINDSTGNTRILPINVKSINHDLYNSIDKDELFMELVRAYASGEAYQLEETEFQILNEVSREFENIAFERELINKFFKLVVDQGEFLTATEIKDIIEINTKQRIMSMKKFGSELRNLFGTPKHRDKAQKYWVQRRKFNPEIL